MRLFIAVAIPPKVKRALAEAQERLPNEGGLKRVEPHLLHITLKFLGEVNPKMLERIGNALGEVSFSPFYVDVRGVGVFPSPDYIRVVWAGCENRALEKLAEQINGKLAGLFAEEKFSPHITIARVKRKLALGDYLKENAGRDFGRFQVGEFHLVESILGSGGPKYSILSTYRAKINS